MAQNAPNVSEMVTTTMVRRRKEIADNITKNNAVLDYLTKGGMSEVFGGGREIQEAMDYEETDTIDWFQGAEIFRLQQQEVLTAARYPIKQAYGTVAIDGLTQILNMGPEAVINISNSRIKNMQKSFKNFISKAVYANGTARGGKSILGLDAFIPQTPESGTVGGINRADHEFWRTQRTVTADRGKELTSKKPTAAGFNAANEVWIEDEMAKMWQATCRGKDKVDLIIADNLAWRNYWASLGEDRRYTGEAAAGPMADSGWKSLHFMGIEVVMDGGIGGFAPSNQMFFLNREGLHWRPVKGRNFTIRPKAQVSIDQDVFAVVMLFAGAFTLSWSMGQGRIGKTLTSQVANQ